MNLFFNALLTSSLGMSAVILALLLLNRALGDRLPATHRYFMWLVVLIALLIPFRPAVTLPFEPVRVPLPLAAAASEAPLGGVPGSAVRAGNPLPSEPAGDFSAPPAMASPAGSPGPAAERPPLSRGLLMFGVWGIGGLGVLAFHLRSYARFTASVRRWGTDTDDARVLAAMRAAQADLGLGDRRIAVKTCALASSPMLIGFLEPAILLPEKAISPDELEYVFRHELTHFKRRDLWVNALILLVSAMHWFNPLVWLMARTIRADCEASCDEMVVAGVDTDERRQYGETIIGFAGAGNMSGPALSTYFYGGSENMKRRLVSIMDTSRKNRVLMTVCAMAVLVATILSGSALAVQAAEQYVGEERAKAIAYQHAGVTAQQVDFARAFLVRDDGRIVYDVEFYSGDREFDYEIDAVSGRIIEYDRDVVRPHNAAAQTPPAQPDPARYIGEARAKAIALADAKLSEPQVRRMRVKLDREHGTMVYEVEFRRNFMEYEYEIDAVSGAILQSSADYDD